MADNHNMYAALREQFPPDLDRWAVETDNGLCYSWRDLDRASAMMANLLTSLGLPAGARVAVQVEKSVEALALYLATLRAGLVFLPLNTAYQKSEIEYFVTDAEPAVVVCTSAHFGWVSKIAFRQGTAHVFTLNDDRSGSLLDRAAHFGDGQVPVQSDADDLAAILYTSGTTGRSKGAMLTHGNLLSNAQVLQRYWGWRTPEQGGDVLIHALPIFHVHGLFVALHGALLNGSPMLWMGKFDPRRAIAWMARATVFMGVPTLYGRMLGEPTLTQKATAGMRLFISGSAPLLLETFNEWRERTGHTILERYGMSETIMLTSNPCGRDVRYAMQAQRKGGTVGFPLPGVELRVVDETLRSAPVDGVGAIQVRGPNVFKGYWRMPEKTREEFTTDGWFKTGDMGRQDAEGYVTIVGRSKDLIISGGYNVYPAEVEAYLNELAGVAESAVVGTAHPDFGEVGVAFVVPRPGSSPNGNELLQQLKTRLAHFKVPKRCLLVPELPRNTMGKVQKNVLRAWVSEAPAPECASG
jgi:malonyl-CoA/methylmalonyl-CoA synthetase